MGRGGWYGKREKEEKSEKKFTRTQFRVSRVSAGNVWPWLWRSRWRNRYRRGGGLLFAYVARGGGGRDGWRRRRKAGFNAHASCIFKPPARYSCTRKLNPNARLRRWPLQPPSTPLHLSIFVSLPKRNRSSSTFLRSCIRVYVHNCSGPCLRSVSYWKSKFKRISWMEALGRETVLTASSPSFRVLSYFLSLAPSIVIFLSIDTRTVIGG